MSTVASALSIKGERRTGQDVRTQNVMAASSIANIVKVSKRHAHDTSLFQII
jgi:T-complex protein 1 subunit alpha